MRHNGEKKMTIKIINANGSDTRTSNVDLSDAQAHIDARDRFATEAGILLAYVADASLADRDPIAWKYNDPTEDARFLFDESEIAEIEREDASLIVRITVTRVADTDVTLARLADCLGYDRIEWDVENGCYSGYSSDDDARFVAGDPDELAQLARWHGIA
jgi:hypothetical protein